MRRDRRKDLCRRERDSLEGPHEEAEIQRKALRRGKNLAFSEDTCLEKERVRSKVTPRKVGVGLKRKREPSRRRLGWRLACWGSTEKEASHLFGLRERHQYSDQLMLHPDGSPFLPLQTLPSCNAFTKRLVAPSPAAFRRVLSDFFLKSFCLPYESM